MADEPPWSIEHRGLAYHYTADIYIYRYREDEPPWSINHRGLAYCYTADIYIYIVLHCLYIYIAKGDEPPGQSITEALHTTTLLIYR